MAEFEEVGVPQHVGPDTVLSGRYRLTVPASSDVPGMEAWDAKDDVLGRAVRVQLISGPAGAKALDGARRAALADDPRLVRILDVGESGSTGYVITEQLPETTLADILANGPLTADQARAVVGEVADALESARRRGVHHLGLRPGAIHLGDDGSVVVSGTGIDGVLLGVSATDARATTRMDAVDLVALVYAALTATWPGYPGLAGGLPIAERRDGFPIPPADIEPSVPNDLDTLCSVTFGEHDDGPHSPAELTSDLRPWDAVRTDRSMYLRPPAEPVQPEVSPEMEASAEPASAQPEMPALAVAAAAAGTDGLASGTSPWAATSSGTVTGDQRRIDFRNAGQPAARGGDLSMDDASGATAQTAPPTPADLSAPASPPVSAGSPTPTVTAGANHGAAMPSANNDDYDGSATDPALDDGPSTAALSALERAADGLVDPATSTPSGQVPVGNRPIRRSAMDGFVPGAGAARAVAAASERKTPPPAAPARPVHSTTPRYVNGGAGPGPAAPPVRRSSYAPGTGAAAGATVAYQAPAPAPITPPSGQSLPGGQGMSGDPDGPFGFPAASDEPPTRTSGRTFDPTKVVIIIVAAMIVIGGVFAANSILNWNLPIPSFGGGGAPSPSASTSSTPSATSAAAAPTIASAEALDPYGDNNEHPETVARAVDGDPSTMWSTRFYKNPSFGNKPGVGIRIVFDDPAKLSELTLTTGGTGGVIKVMRDVPAADGSGDVLAEVPMATPTTKITLSEPTELSSVVIWFSELPTASDGKYRVDLSEVEVR